RPPLGHFAPSGRGAERSQTMRENDYMPGGLDYEPAVSRALDRLNAFFERHSDTIAILGSIGTSLYRRDMASAPSAARATLGAALALAEKLPAPGNVELAEVARGAFTSSLRFTSAVAGVIVTAIAILSAVMASAQARACP